MKTTTYLCYLFTFVFVLIGNANVQALELLTPVDDPFSYQNEYYPIDVGNYWSYRYYRINNNRKTFVGFYQTTITEYTYKEIKFVDSVYYIPVYKLNYKLVYENGEIDSVDVPTYYLIKMNEGIVITEKSDISSYRDILYLIPSSILYDYLSLKLTNKIIERDADLEINGELIKCLRIGYSGREAHGSLYYLKGISHIVSIFYSYDKQNGEFILDEYKLK